MVANNKTTKKPGKTSTQKAKPTKKQIVEAIEKIKSKAEGYARDPKKAKELLDDAIKKAKGFEKNRGPLGEVWGYLTALFRLFRAYIRGEYRDIPWGSIVLITVGIIYFVSPIDLIPDALVGIGFIDDAAVIAFVVAQTKADLDDFLDWEIAQAEDESNESTLVK
jgi:uncharacterized membrane protein YkvA (DUF1232 family)